MATTHVSFLFRNLMRSYHIPPAPFPLPLPVPLFLSFVMPGAAHIFGLMLVRCICTVSSQKSPTHTMDAEIVIGFDETATQICTAVLTHYLPPIDPPMGRLHPWSTTSPSARATLLINMIAQSPVKRGRLTRTLCDTLSPFPSAPPKILNTLLSLTT
jgi:hypothetical protein